MEATRKSMLSWKPAWAGLLFALWAILLGLQNSLTGLAIAQDESEPILGISKSTVAYLADPVGKSIQMKASVFLSAGTCLLLYDEYDPEGTRRLFLSEIGVWGDIKEGQYFSGDAITQFKNQPEFVFITRRQEIDLGSDLIGLLTPTETYRLMGKTPGMYKIRIDNKKFRHFRSDWYREVLIPKGIAKVVTSFEKPSEDSIDYFTRGFLDEIYEIWKPCREADVQTKKLGAGVGFRALISKFGLSLSAEVEKKRIREFSKDEIVHRRYYTRNVSGGEYSVTKIEACGGPDKRKVTYHYINPEPMEIIIDSKWAESYSLPTYKRTGEVVVSCYEQYDDFHDALLDSGLSEEEIPFVIAVTAKWKDFRDFQSCFTE